MSHERRQPGRRDFLALGVGALAVATLPRALRRDEALVRRRIPVMGTIAEVAVRHRDEAWAQRAIDAAFAELRRVDATMSVFLDVSDVGKANRAPRGVPVVVCEDTAEVVAAALTIAAHTDGRFDPCLGRMSELWGVGHRTSPPDASDVRPLAGRALYPFLELERAGGTSRLRLHHEGAALDLGGVAKGYGVDLAARALRDQGVFHGLVNAGGDLVALGTNARGESWKVGVRAPNRPDQVAQVLEVRDEAVATSGDYLQFFEHGGRRYHHILDPLSGSPRVSGMRSLTVAAPCCVDADAAATAGFGAGTEADRIVRSAAGARIVHTI